jgi:branched-subunit amino acid aminotransferase/4-amino-4-deoxychorismate lyase
MNQTHQINRTLLYGEGLFETLRVYRGRRVPLLEAHSRRMARGAEFFRFPFSPSAFKRAVEEELRMVPEEAEARLRVTLEVWGEEGPTETRLITRSAPLSGTDEGSGVRLIRAPFARSSGSPLLAFKTTNYFENSYARQWARRQGYDDALFFNERAEITETTAANLFFIRGRNLITSPVSAGLLPGIARGVVLSDAGGHGLVAEERPVTAADLQGADEILVSNAVIEVVPVREIAGIFAKRSPFDWAGALRAAYREQVFAGAAHRMA